MDILIACEYSAVVRDAFRARGHNAWSCDILPCDRDPRFHIQGDVLQYLDQGWHQMIAHPPCTRLTLAGIRWLHNPPKGKTIWQMWAELVAAVDFYRKVRAAPIPRIAIENPKMHSIAESWIKPGPRQIVQPWWFGVPEFKGLGFELYGLPRLKPTNMLTPPKTGTPEHVQWSKVHRASPGPLRWKERSTTRQGVAEALAEQWG